MTRDRGAGPRFPRSTLDLVVGTLVSLRDRGRKAEEAAGWRSGAHEFHLPVRPTRRRLGAVGTAPSGSSLGARFARPILVLGFIGVFAGIGAGFGSLPSDPDSALAPSENSGAVRLTISEAEPAASSPSTVRALTTEPPASGGTVDQDSLAPGDPEASNPVAEADDSLASEPTPTATNEPSTSTPIPAATATAVPPTVPPPTSTPAPAVQLPPVSPLTEGELRAAAASAGWPPHLLDQLVEVAWCESSYLPNASSGFAYGIMQLVPGWFEYAGVPFEQWSDPAANLRVAYAVYQYDISRGREPWTQWVCRPSSPAAAAPADETAATPVAAEPTSVPTLASQ